jgi:DNA-binding NtrC family response regulator
MRERYETIEKHLALAESLYRRGAYRDAYDRARLALGLCGGADVPLELRCRALVQSAKGAYCAGAFEESLGHLDAARSLLDGLPPGRRDAVASEGAIVRANVMRRQGRFAEALDALASAPDDDAEPAALVERFLIEGACRFYLNDLPRAEDRLEAALGLSIHYNDSRMKSRVLIMLGLVAQIKGLYEAALEYFERAGEICRAGADYYGEAAAALNASIALYRRGYFARAAESAERARAIFENVGWSLGACRATLSLGNVARYRGDDRQALRRYREARRLAGRLGFARELALAIEFTGDILASRGRPLRAERCYGEALRLAEASAPEGDVVVEINRRLGELLVSLERVDAALPFLRRALRFSQRLGDRLEEGAVLRCLARASFLLGAPERGKNLFARAIEILRNAGCDFELARTHAVYAGILLAMAENRPASRAADGSDGGALDEAWRNAVEAAHLFGGMDAESWKASAERLAMKAASRRERRAAAAPAVRAVSRVMEIRPSPAMFLHEGFVAISVSMLEAWKQIRFAAAFDRPVLVTGETGTGKELVARLIHELSERGNRPFVALNCGAVPDHLFESEFFGHRRGSFTGALLDRVGLFESASGGTLFLDEVGELTPLQQVKLLRVLQEEKIRRLGENVERPVNVRIISATNQDLEERLSKQSFRKDFFYRINAEHIHVPPLRERREDIVPLAGHFLGANGSGAKPVSRIELAALRSLQRYAWPGNVRELMAVLDRARHLADGGVIAVDMLPERIKAAAGAGEPAAVRAGRIVDPAERLRRAIEACGGNKSAAARWLGISRGTLYKELRRCGLNDLANGRACASS